MSPVIFNVGLFLARRYMGDVIGLFCVSETIQTYDQYPKTIKEQTYPSLKQKGLTQARGFPRSGELPSPM